MCMIFNMSFYSHCFGFDFMNSLCYCLLLVLDPTDGRLPGTCVAAAVTVMHFAMVGQCLRIITA